MYAFRAGLSDPRCGVEVEIQQRDAIGIPSTAPSMLRCTDAATGEGSILGKVQSWHEGRLYLSVLRARPKAQRDVRSPKLQTHKL